MKSKSSSNTLVMACPNRAAPSNLILETGLERAEISTKRVVCETVFKLSRSEAAVVVCLSTDPFSLSCSLATAFQHFATLESPKTSNITILYEIAGLESLFKNGVLGKGTEKGYLDLNKLAFENGNENW
jgi:hypothetical protein